MSAAPLTFMPADTANDEETAIVAQNLVKTYKRTSTTEPKQALKGGEPIHYVSAGKCKKAKLFTVGAFG